jgi:hypothetical protein
MFCKNCGKKILKNDIFCTECGYSIHPSKVNVNTKILQTDSRLDQKWWLRLAKVIYIILYVLLLLICYFVWTINRPDSYYDFSSNQYITTRSYSPAIWCSLLTIAIGIVVLRLIKIIFFYIIFAQKPKWKKEFKKFF